MPRLTIKDHIRESMLFSERVALALVLVSALMLVITGRLVYLQILSHDHFATQSDANRIDIVPIPPTRGLIYDRNGVLLAQNLPSYSLEIIPEQVTDMDSTLLSLKKLIQLSDEDISRFRGQLKQSRSFKSIPLRLHLSDDEVARFAVNRYHFPGVDVEARLIRDYPLGKLAVHATGYVGRINEDELRRLDPSNYSATRFIGKTGIENYYENILHGRVGFKQVETNAMGRTVRTLKRTPPVAGKNIYLTLDMQLQKTAEAALEGMRGAIVAIDPRNGEVLVMSSTPGYDPNLFVTGINSSTYQALQHSADNPLFNRALNGQYPPGSTVKPFIALAGLEYGKIGINTTSFCPGWFTLKGDKHKYRDWKHRGHGVTNLDKAIVESCDVFFYDLAFALGIDRIHDYLAQFGFGLKTGIDLPGESQGLLPSRAWKRRNRHQPWYPGETLITGIGQGYTLATPMQLATAAAVMANRGVFVQPHLVYALQRPDGDKLDIQETPPGRTAVSAAPKNWKTVTTAMTRVVHSRHGTARGIGYNIPFRIAGKTGTAQVFGIKQDEKYIKEEVAVKLRDHALFIAFAPADNPKIALAIVIENGGSGASAAAPVARRIIDRYLLHRKT